MGPFEHVLSLLSFVYALAVAHLLSGAAMLIRAGARVRVSPVHAGWMVIALLVIIADWISFWDLRGLKSWSIATIWFFLLMGVANYLGAALVCPEVPAEGTVDLPAFHREQGTRYIAAFLASVCFALFGNVVIGGAFLVSEWAGQNIAVAPMLAFGLVAMFAKARWAQIGAVVAIIALFAWYFARLQPTLT